MNGFDGNAAKVDHAIAEVERGESDVGDHESDGS